MCTDCGCALTKHHQHLSLAHSLLHNNQQQALRNRQLFAKHSISVFNLMSSPGSGKTELLKQLIPQLQQRCAIVVGDLQTDNDAQRLRTTGAPTLQITTGHACHLDAQMIANACQQLPLTEIDILFIENVGNLVCPADFDLGQDANIVLLAVTEGDDKPSKYPAIFRSANLIIQSKSDLLPHMRDFRPESFQENLERIGTNAATIALSAYDSLEELKTWLAGNLKRESVRAEP